jgi:hypothetical protein
MMVGHVAPFYGWHGGEEIGGFGCSCSIWLSRFSTSPRFRWGDRVYLIPEAAMKLWEQGDKILEARMQQWRKEKAEKTQKAQQKATQSAASTASPPATTAAATK